MIEVVKINLCWFYKQEYPKICFLSESDLLNDNTSDDRKPTYYRDIITFWEKAVGFQRFLQIFNDKSVEIHACLLRDYVRYGRY